MARLREEVVGVLSPRVAGTSDCVLLDFQNHGNVGDSAIWLGEIAFLERARCRIRHVCTKDDYDPRQVRRAVGEGLILISGGGNLGDVWPAHQSFRERVLADFPGHRIVQLPQSIHFERAEEIRRARRAMHAHGGFRLMVRDRQSLLFARRELDIDADLCPDMVHMLDLPELAPDVAYRLLLLAREDREKRSGPDNSFDPAALGDCLVTDWVRQPRPPESKRYRRARALGRRRWLPRAPFDRLALHTANRLAWRRLEFGYGLLGRAGAIVSDRLHACLLARLGGRRVYFVDNSYGKLSSYVETWLADDPDLLACSSFEEALERAQLDSLGLE